MPKVQRNLYVTPAALAGWQEMAARVGVTGQRGSTYSALDNALGEAFEANPEACSILVRLILDGRMTQPFTERAVMEMFDHE